MSERPRFILNTRPAVYRARTEAAFAPARLPVVHWPILDPRPTGAAWPESRAFEAIIFTSQMAVGLAPASWRGVTAYAVGEGTEEAARSVGFAKVVRTGQDAADMIAVFSRSPPGHALYASGTDVTVDLATAFPGAVERLAVYEMVAADRVPDPVAERIRGGRAIAPLFSRRAGSTLSRLLTAAGLAQCDLDAVGISAGVFDAPGPWRGQVVAAAPTLEAVAAEVIKLAQTR